MATYGLYGNPPSEQMPEDMIPKPTVQPETLCSSSFPSLWFTVIEILTTAGRTAKALIIVCFARAFYISGIFIDVWCDATCKLLMMYRRKIRTLYTLS